MPNFSGQLLFSVFLKSLENSELLFLVENGEILSNQEITFHKIENNVELNSIWAQT